MSASRTRWCTRLPALVGQRIVGIALGYEDVNDHDELRHDPVLALFAEKLEPKRADCAPLAGKSTLNRLEHAPLRPDDRYHKIGHDPAALANLFVDLFLEAHKGHRSRSSSISTPPTTLCTVSRRGGSFTATTAATATCRSTCSAAGICSPPYCGPRTSTPRPARSSEVARIVERIRAAWPRVRILLRADSGFARDELMTWCEANRVDYIFGLARNPRLVAELEADLAVAAAAHAKTGQPVRRFKEFSYATLHSWSRARRVIGQGRTPGQGPQSPLHRHLAAGGGDRRPDLVRAALLRPRRDGEPDQRAAAGPVRRPHLGRDHARQPTPSLVRVLCLRAARGLAPHRPAPHPIPGRHLRHDPTETAQARRPGHGLGAPDQGGDCFGLPVSHRVRARPSAARRGPAVRVAQLAANAGSADSSPRRHDATGPVRRPAPLPQAPRFSAHRQWEDERLWLQNWSFCA